MQHKQRRISYIKKPIARRSIIAILLAAAAFLCTGVSLGISVNAQGSGGVEVACWAVWGIANAAFSLWYGLLSFMEKEKNYVLTKIGMGISGTLLVFWICVLISGILG